MFTTKNNMTVLVGDISKSRTSSVQITDPSASSTYIADGEVVVLDENGIPVTGAITVLTDKKIKLVQRSGATAATCNLIFTPWIYHDQVVSCTANTYDAGQEQIYVVGYDAVTATTKIDVTTDLVDFMLNVKYTGNIDLWQEQSAVKTYLVPYVTSISQATVAASFAKQINNDPSSLVSAVNLTPTAGAALTGTLTVTNNSTVVTSSGAETWAVGDFLRIGSQSTATSPMYKIASVTSTTVAVLESPFQGTTATTVTGGLLVAASATGNFGVKLTGKALYWELGQFRYLKTRFVLGYKQGMGNSTLTKTQEAKPGNGVYEQVAEMEWFAKSVGGALNRTMIPINPIFNTIDATSGSTYDTISINFYDRFLMNSTISEAGRQPQQVMIFLGVSAGQNKGSNTDVADSLEAWLDDTLLSSGDLTNNIT